MQDGGIKLNKQRLFDEFFRQVSSNKFSMIKYRGDLCFISITACLIEQASQIVRDTYIKVPGIC